ncbi:gamma-glutamyl-gamma-aminobutyrate hydrolase family protein [Streptomyces sp. Je 1-369]|uniref:gamma-glutamyl-gamma-aminobutyrate hydrolase family protein n=1 Tax=Streptomyces sp. Je 1-369 TaxID=2966192 RepID=UPI0022854923|nr:gamma-glutamyl-gamma-aminobutyrate hydrolase family protein [Streptomyces sp. Je 1-369]WAL93078.1 gamma-glutamyl-gamma-aminobutyrate hydrolase family protein [Streptomyces sp. Je 1-369]WAL99902.1 gamma-glutamyl-gamma-aminobutyrate hydrolase family protein [Streptomyces sp. Je 1-369]
MNAAKPPVVGITARTVPVTLQGTDMVVSLSLQSHVDFLAAAGCVPVVLPVRPGVEQLLDGLQGLLVPGGPDIDPALYGQERHPLTRVASTELDRAELALIGAALAAELPLLAICRGMQLLNVRCGGTLHQHLPEVTGTDAHRPQGAGFEFGRHVLDLRSGSRIARVYGDDTPKTACHHHQAVDRIGEHLAATARTPDGVVEAVEAVGHPFALGVQWEAGQTEDERLHRALADAARRR